MVNFTVLPKVVISGCWARTVGDCPHIWPRVEPCFYYFLGLTDSEISFLTQTCQEIKAIMAFSFLSWILRSSFPLRVPACL